MYNEKRIMLYGNYIQALNFYTHNPDALINLERHITSTINELIVANYEEIEHDYNEASYLNPLWSNYPPEERGRAPVV